MIVDQSHKQLPISKLVKISCAEHLYVELLVGQYIGNKMSEFSALRKTNMLTLLYVQEL